MHRGSERKGLRTPERTFRREQKGPTGTLKVPVQRKICRRTHNNKVILLNRYPPSPTVIERDQSPAWGVGGGSHTVVGGSAHGPNISGAPESKAGNEAPKTRPPWTPAGWTMHSAACRQSRGAAHRLSSQYVRYSSALWLTRHSSRLLQLGRSQSADSSRRPYQPAR